MEHPGGVFVHLLRRHAINLLNPSAHKGEDVPAVGPHLVLIDQARRPAGDFVDKGELVFQALPHAVLVGDLLNHPHLGLNHTIFYLAVETGTHPDQLPIGTAPAVFHHLAVHALQGLLDLRPVFGLHAFNQLATFEQGLLGHAANMGSTA